MAGPRTDLTDGVAELGILWPHLAHALERDAGQLDGERVATGEASAFGLPLNADVLQARTAMETEVPRLMRWAVGVVAETAVASSSIPVQLQHFPRLHERMLVTAAATEAGQLEREVAALLRRVRLAIGLRTVDRPLRHWCPMHDDPLTELVVPGAEGTLVYRRLDAAGQPIAPQVAWVRQEHALCRHCKAAWPYERWLLLGRMLSDAHRRRAASQTASAALEASAGGAA